jgi:hypothetical protein
MRWTRSTRITTTGLALMFRMRDGSPNRLLRMKSIAKRILHCLFCLHPRNEAEPSEEDLPPAGSGGNASLIIAPSLIPHAGLGCFADRDYQSGEVVCEYTGTVLSTVQMLRTRDWTYMMGLGKDRTGRRVWVDARVHLRVKARYINHHFDASHWNLNLRYLADERKCVLTANRLIRKGEELYFDYGAPYSHRLKKEIRRAGKPHPPS